MEKRIPQARQEVLNFLPYVPGKSLEEIKAEYGLESIVKLASNENVWGFSDRAAEAMRRELGRINIYPEPVPVAFSEKAARSHGVTPESVITGNGTDEIIDLICRTFLKQGDSLLVSRNSFVRYKMAAQLMGVEVKEIPRKGYGIDPQALAETAGRDTKLIFIDNPCNPTGTFITREESAEMLDMLQERKVFPLVVFDEAYFDYADDSSYGSGLELMNHNEVPVMVLRTFSKIYGMAGLRFGYGISHPGITSLVQRVKPPFNTNRLAQAAALAALEDREFVRKTAESNRSEKKFLYGKLEELGVDYVKSQANFILINTGSPADAEKLSEFLIKRGVVVRPLAGYKLPGHLRITVGRREHNIRMIEGIREYVTEGE